MMLALSSVGAKSEHYQLLLTFKNVVSTIYVLTTGRVHYGQLILILTVILSKKGGKYQETIQSSTTPDPGYQMGK